MMSEAINRAIAMLQDYRYDLASQNFSDNDEGDMLQRRNENKRATVDAAITGLRAELATLKAGQGEAVATYMGTDWDAQHQFMAQCGDLEPGTDLYTAPPATGVDDLVVPRELLANFIEYSVVHRDGVEELWNMDNQKLRALLARQEVK